MQRSYGPPSGRYSVIRYPVRTIQLGLAVRYAYRKSGVALSLRQAMQAVNLAA